MHVVRMDVCSQIVAVAIVIVLSFCIERQIQRNHEENERSTLFFFRVTTFSSTQCSIHIKLYVVGSYYYIYAMHVLYACMYRRCNVIHTN